MVDSNIPDRNTAGPHGRSTRQIATYQIATHQIPIYQIHTEDSQSKGPFGRHQEDVDRLPAENLIAS